MVQRKGNTKRVNKLRKETRSMRYWVVGILLIVAFVSVLLIGGSGRYFAAFSSSEDWMGDVSMVGMYLPNEATTKTYYPSGVPDTMVIDFDGQPISFGMSKSMGAGRRFTTGERAHVMGDIGITMGSEVNEGWYNADYDLYRRAEYNNWGSEGYIRSSWYPNLENYYSYLPNVGTEIGSLAHITGDSTADTIKVVSQDVPSVTGTSADGYYYEQFMYMFDLTLQIHADAADLGDLSYMEVYAEGSGLSIQNPFELASIDELYTVFGINVDVLNDTIIEEWAEMKTFGAHEVQFYEWDAQGSFTKPLSRYTVSEEMNPTNWPGAPLFTRRLSETRFNEDYLMTGYDPTMGLSVVDSTVISDLPDDGKHYFMFGVDQIGVPAYYYQDIGALGGVAEYYGIFDLQVTFPLFLSVSVLYDVDLGVANTRTVNTDGILLVGNDTNPYKDDWKVQVATALNIPVDMALPVVAIGAVVLFVVFGKRR